MSTEPLWRGPWGELSKTMFSSAVHPQEEVEVWPAGDRTSPTREQIEAIGKWLMEHRGWDSADVEELTEGFAALALLHGQGDETHE